MRREYIFVSLWIVGLLLVSIQATNAQPALIGFIYYDDGTGNPEPPITDGAGQPAPDGTAVRVLQDLGAAGPDTADISLGGFNFNSESLGFPAGYFIVDSWMVAEASDVLYVSVLLPNRCWHTVSYVVVPGLQEISISADEWTMSPPPCPWNLPMASVEFWYCIHPPWYLERPIGCPCDNPSGDTLVAVMHDVNTNGPDGIDTVLTAFVPDEEVPDCIWVSPLVEIPSNFPVYLQIGAACCWTTGTFVSEPGFQGIDLTWGSWSCVTIPCQSVASEPRVPELPEGFELIAIYPNPFNSATQIDFVLPRAGVVSIDIYDILGQQVTTLANRTFDAGAHTLVWDARDLGSGVYLCRASSGDVAMTRKLLLLK